MGGVFHIFADCREARRRLEGRVVALERTSARFGAKREVTEREVVERQKKDWNCAFSTGWPDSLDAVEPFLRNLFLDPDIIPMGPLGFLRKPLANYIAKKRSVPVRGRYALIGRRSPIGILTERQRRALVAALSPDLDAVAVTR